MRGSRINRCLHCGKEFIGSACVIKIICYECEKSGHTQNMFDKCPQCQAEWRAADTLTSTSEAGAGVEANDSDYGNNILDESRPDCYSTTRYGIFAAAAPTRWP